MSIPKRNLGYTEMEFTVIGLGTWAIGGGNWAYGWGPQDEKQAISAIRAAIDNGINWIDTAPVYGLGRSEEIVGKAIKGLRDKVFVATKLGLVWDEKEPQKPPYSLLSRERVRKEIEDSLKRLGIDYIDLWQIHWPGNDENARIEAWEEMAKIVEEGKVRYIGVSNFTVEQMKVLMSIHPIASDQPIYNILVRDIEKDVVPFCQENNIGIVSYSPLLSGMLTEKFSREWVASLPDNDWRKSKATGFQPPELDRNLEIVAKLRELAHSLGFKVHHLAIAWVINRKINGKPAVTSAIVGARKPEQVEDNLKALELKMTDEIYAEIDKIVGL